MAAAQKWRTEDWVAVYLGFFIIAAALVVFSGKLFDLGQVRSTFRWTTDAQIASRAAGWSDFWGAVNHQGDYFDSTVAAIPFLVEAVGRPKPHSHPSSGNWAPYVQKPSSDSDGPPSLSSARASTAVGTPMAQREEVGVDLELRAVRS